MAVRDFINIIVLMESAVPTVLYHGTSEDAWGEIQARDEMVAMEGGDDAICFSASQRVAEDFARQAAVGDMCEKGIVIAFDAKKLAQLHHLTAFHDPKMSGTTWAHFLDEEEFRIEQATAKGIMSAVIGTTTVWAESAPEFHERKTNSEIVFGAVHEVRDAYHPNFRGACEGAAHDLSEILTRNNIENEVVEGRYNSPMDWGDGSQHPFTPHWWVEVGHFILDPTREQFGSSELIVNKNLRGAAAYERGGVGQVDPV